MKTIIIENTWLTRGLINFGWGNGYVLIPEGHPCHGKHYEKIKVDVHGGLTFSETVNDDTLKWCDQLTKEDTGSWLVGFDTCHFSDSLESWPKEKVQDEADRLMKQLSKKRKRQKAIQGNTQE